MNYVRGEMSCSGVLSMCGQWHFLEEIPHTSYSRKETPLKPGGIVGGTVEGGEVSSNSFLGPLLPSGLGFLPITQCRGNKRKPRNLIVPEFKQSTSHSNVCTRHNV